MTSGDRHLNAAITFNHVNAAIDRLSRAPDAHAMAEDVVAAPLDRAQQLEINRPHDARRHEPSLVVARQRRLGFPIEAPRPLDLKGEQPLNLVGHHPGTQIVLGATEAPQILDRDVHAVALEIGRHVADDIRQLQRDAQIDRVIAGLQIAISEDLDADEAHGRRHAKTILAQLFERIVSIALQIHRHAVDQVLETRPRKRKRRDERREVLALRCLWLAAVIEARQLAAPLRKRRRGIAVSGLVHGIIYRPAEVPHRDDGVALVGGQRKK